MEKQRRFLSFRSIYGRLLMMFLLTIMVFEIIVVAICMWGQQTVQEETQQLATREVLSMQDQLVNWVSTAEELQHQLINYGTLTYFVNRYDSLSVGDFYLQINEIRDHMSLVLQSNSFVERMDMHVPSIELTIASDIVRPMDMSQWPDRLNEYFDAVYPIYERDNAWHMGICYPSNALQKRKIPLFFLELTLSSEAIHRMLDRSVANTDAYAVVTNHTSGTMYFSHATPVSVQPVLRDSLRAAESFTGSVTIDGKAYSITSLYEPALNVSVSRFVPMSIIGATPQKFTTYLLLVSVVLMGILILYSVVSYRSVRRPTFALVNAFRKLESGDMNVSIEEKCDYEFYYLVSRFNVMVKCLRTLIEQEYLNQLYISQIELKHLQSQINPHFFYNSFFLLHRLIQDEDTEAAMALSSHLGRYYQFITRDGADIVPLRDEYNYAVEYLSIQKMRFDTRLQIEIDELPEDCHAIRVPRMILQPILENAFEHGLRSYQGVGRLRLRFSRTEDALQLITEDNGDGLTDERLLKLAEGLAQSSHDGQHQTTGLENIHRRLRLRFGDSGGLHVCRGALGGMCIIMRIPMEGVKSE